MKKLLSLILFILTATLNPYPVYADVPIGEKFGFGDITSFGQATKSLVGPIFSIASFLVILYFLLGAFKYLRGGGNKEEAAEARQMISHAIVGFIILMFAFLILQFVIFKLFNIEFSIIG